MPNEPLPTHSGMPIAVELLVRQVVFEGLHDIANDETRLRELVRRVDDLDLGSQVDDWENDLVRAFLDLLAPDGPDALKVLVGYPLASADLPCISIVKEGAAEDTAASVLGDVLQVRYVQVGTETYQPQDPTAAPQEAPLLHEHKLLGGGWTSTVQVATWTTAPELSLLLDAAVNDALFRGKRRLIAAGVTDVSLSETGSPTDEPAQLKLRCAYTPIQRATLDWTRGTTRRKGPVPNRVRILPGLFSV